MTLIRTNAFGSDGHLLFPLRRKYDSFPTVRCKDEAQWGTYRTKDTIVEIYAALAETQRIGHRLPSL